MPCEKGVYPLFFRFNKFIEIFLYTIDNSHPQNSVFIAD